MGYYEFILEEIETDTDNGCKGIVFGHSYAAKNECGVIASYHSVRKVRIEGYQENKDYPPCAKVTELLILIMVRSRDFKFKIHIYV
jgi:hypothetical protein